MILACPSCSARYQIAPIAPPGRRVRCARCRHVWFAEPELEADSEGPVAAAPWSATQAEAPPPEPPTFAGENDQAGAGTALASRATLAEPDGIAGSLLERLQATPATAREPRPQPDPFPGLGTGGSPAESAGVGADRPPSVPRPEPADAPWPFEARPEPPTRPAYAPEWRPGYANGASEPVWPAVQPPPTFGPPVAYPPDQQAPQLPFPEASRPPPEWRNEQTAPLAPAQAEPAYAPPPRLSHPPQPAPKTAAQAHVPAAPRRGRAVLRGLGATAMIGTLVGLAALALHERRAVVAALPGTAKAFAAIGMPVNVMGLEIRNVKVEWIEELGQAELDVRGEVHNVSSEERVVPLVAVWVRNRAGEELIQWPARVGLGSVSRGGFTRFQARVPAPPSVTAVTASVVVRFGGTR